MEALGNRWNSIKGGLWAGSTDERGGDVKVMEDIHISYMYLMTKKRNVPMLSLDRGHS